MSAWIGVDFDGTLAHYPSENENEIGSPIPRMVRRVKEWREEGWEVRIVTARACDADLTLEVEQWCLLHLGEILPVTDRKDFEMIALYDDRAYRVIANTGKIVGEMD